MALDVAAEHVVEAEQGGGQEEEPGSEIIVQTEGDIINLDIIFWPGLEEAGKAHDCPEYVDHDQPGLTSSVIISYPCYHIIIKNRPGLGLDKETRIPLAGKAKI